jgi:hypothetical protein
MANRWRRATPEILMRQENYSVFQNPAMPFKFEVKFDSEATLVKSLLIIFLSA